MARKPLEWHETARKMRSTGLGYAEIGRRLNVSQHTVRDFLTDRYQRDLNIIGDKRQNALIEQHAPRAIPPKPNNLAIAKLFASGAIDRPTMSRMLRGQIPVPVSSGVEP